MIFPSLKWADIVAAIKSYFSKGKKQAVDEDLVKKDQAREFIDYYNGIQEKYLKGLGFEDKTTGADLIPKMTLNMTKKIIDKVSMVYKYPPVRILVDDEGVEIEDAQVYAKWIQYVETFDNYITEAERQKNLFHKVLWRTHYNPVLRKWIFLVEWDYKAHFIAGDPLNPVGYSVPVVIDKEHLETGHRVSSGDQIYLYYDDRNYFYYNTKGATWTYYTDYNGEKQDNGGDNVYGISPFVELRKTVPVFTYESGGALDLISANKAININMNNLNMALHYQAFGIIWDNSGLSEKEAPEIVVGPSRQIHVEKDVALNNLDLNPKLLEMIDTIKFEVQAISNTYNLTVNWHTEATPVSGFSLIVQNMDYIEQRQNDVDMAKKQETQIFKTIRAQQDYHKAEIKEGEPVIPDANLRVDFAELDLPINQTEEIQVKQYKLNNNIISPLDEIKADNPDMTDEEAEAKFERNKQLNKKYGLGDALKERVTNLGGLNEPT